MASEYWTGRFVALHDRFQAETLDTESLEILVAAHATRASVASSSHLRGGQRSSHLPPSKTTIGLSQVNISSKRVSSLIRRADVLNDDDSRCWRIFRHLEVLCTTTEAKQSLHEWQQAYARRIGRPSLLPQGGSMEGRFALMSKLWNSGRKSLGSMPQNTDSRIAAARGVRHHVKRVSLA
jgi:hypothetical protein